MKRVFICASCQEGQLCAKCQERFEAFDRFMSESDTRIPLGLGGDCPCGGSGEHRQGCPFGTEETP